jgi:hypothetical protein
VRVSFTWPREHRIGQVAVQGIHGGTVNGEVGSVLDVAPDGSFTFTFKASESAGHDEIVLTAANVSFTMPLWVTPDGKAPGRPVVNP